MSYTNKAQMEILGVALIVVIVVIGLFFTMFSKPKTFDSKEDVLDSQLAQSLLNAMLQSETECGNQLSAVIEDCYKRNTLCKDSCRYVHEKVADIFNETLDKWGKPYRFYTDRKGERKIILEKDCTQSSAKSTSGLAFLNYKSDTIVITLDLCSR